MNKLEFALALSEKLSLLPEEEIDERVQFCVEMISDCMEEGVSEDEAVAAVGTVEDVAAQIIADIPFAKLIKERVKPKRRLKAWEIILLVLGSPVWLSLLISAFAVIFSVYVSLWAVIVSLWGVFVSLAAVALGCLAGSIVFVCNGDALSGLALLAGGLVCCGLSIFLFYGCAAATKGLVKLAAKTAGRIKKALARKEEAR